MAVLVDAAADRALDLGVGPLAESLLGIGRDVLGDAQPPRSVELHAARAPQRRELLAVIRAHRRVAFHAMAERTREVGAVATSSLEGGAVIGLSIGGPQAGGSGML